MTRLAVLSDVHANTPALRAAIEHLRGQDVDGVAYLGDIVFRGPDPGGSIELLATLEPVAWIRGNTDEWYLESAPDAEGPGGYVAFGRSLLTRPQSAFLGELPRTAVVTLDEATLRCVHGSPRDQSENLFPDTPLGPAVAAVEEDLVACGHTHLPFIRDADGISVFNVGSVGMPFDGDPRASYGIVDDEGDEVRLEIVRVAYDVDETVRLARSSGLPHPDLYEGTVRSGIAAF
jgi:putative phosphoesterase